MGSSRQKSVTYLHRDMREAATKALGHQQDVYEQYRGAQLPSTYVGIQPQEQQALNMMQQYAGGIGQAMPQMAGNEWARTVSGQYLDPTTNPYFQRIVQESVGGAMSPIMGQMATYGGGPGRSGIGAQLTSEAGATTAARLYGSLYNQERQRMMAAIPMGQQVYQQGLMPAMTMGQVGERYGRDVAAQQAETMRQFEYPQRVEQQNLQMLAANPLMAQSMTKASTPFDWSGAILGMVGGLLNPLQSIFGGGGGK